MDASHQLDHKEDHVSEKQSSHGAVDLNAARRAALAEVVRHPPFLCPR